MKGWGDVCVCVCVCGASTGLCAWLPPHDTVVVAWAHYWTAFLSVNETKDRPVSLILHMLTKMGSIRTLVCVCVCSECCQCVKGWSAGKWECHTSLLSSHACTRDVTIQHTCNQFVMWLYDFMNIKPPLSHHLVKTMHRCYVVIQIKNISEKKNKK